MFERKRKKSRKNTGSLNPMFGKISWCKGLKRGSHTEETKEKMRGRIPWNKGKTNVYTKQTLEKLSKSHKGKLSGEKNPFFGKRHSKEILNKMKKTRNGKDGRSKDSIEKQRQWMLNGGAKYTNSFPRNSEKVEKVKQLNREKMLNGQASYMNSFIQNPSKPQIELYKRVKNIYQNSILNYPLIELNYSLDVAIPDLKIWFESDGTYWHQDKEKDLERQRKIEKLGWKCIRYKSNNVKEVPSNDQIIKDITEVIKHE